MYFKKLKKKSKKTDIFFLLYFISQNFMFKYYIIYIFLLQNNMNKLQRYIIVFDLKLSLFINGNIQNYCFRIEKTT